MRIFLFIVVSAFILGPSVSFSASPKKWKPDPRFNLSESTYTTKQRRLRFGLFTECKPVDIIVESLNPIAPKIGLSKEAMKYAAESRLRAARIYRKDADPYLYINLNTAEPNVFNLSLSLNKRLYDSASRHHFHGITWSVGLVGRHGGDMSFIMSSIQSKLDQFITEFLRVNEKACNQRYRRTAK